MAGLAGRPAKPLRLHLIENKAHLTKAQIKARQENEIKFGTERLSAPVDVKADSVAMKKWRELAKLYKGLDFITSSDTDTIAKYCLTYAEYQDLLKQKVRLSETDIDDVNATAEYIKEVLEVDGNDAHSIAALFKKLDYLKSLDGYLKIDAAINKKRELLIKLSDRMFLNPVAKLRNVSQAKQSKKPATTDSFEQQFGNV